MARGRVTVTVRWMGVDVAAIARTLASDALTHAEKCEQVTDLLIAARIETVEEPGEFEQELDAEREVMELLRRARFGPGPSSAPSTAGRNEREIGPGSGPGNS